MKPLRLRVENLTAFRGEQDLLDLSGHQLFAISGPTGAGKSSLLDAMIFALYGTVPRVGKNVKELISQGRDRMCVRLDFMRGDEVYRVTRRVYRGTTPAQAILDKLSGTDTEAPSEPVTNGVTAVNEAIEKIVGLDYDAFTQAVILPQGRFAQFLQSEPKKRNDMLKELLRLQVYERMRARADAEAKLADATARQLEQMLGQAYADATPESVAAVRVDLAAQGKANAAGEPKLQKLEASVAELRERVRRVAALDEARRELGALAGRALEVKADEARLSRAQRADPILPRLEAVEATTRDVAEAEAAARESDARAETAKTTATARAAAVETAERAAQKVTELDARIEALGRAATLSGPLRDARRRATDAEAALTRREREAEIARQVFARFQPKVAAADAALGAAVATEENAAAAFQDAARRDIVGHLRHGLAKGDECPVCERPLAAKPKAVAASDLPALQAAHDRARGALDSARGAAERARLDLASAEQREAVAAAALTDAEKAAAAARQEAERLAAEIAALTTDSDPEAAQKALRQEKARLTEALDRARRAGEEAARALATAVAAAEGTTARLAASHQRATEARARAEEAWREAGFGSAAAARDAVLPRAEQKQLAELLEAWKRGHDMASARVETLERELAGVKVDAATLAKLAGQLEKVESELADKRRERERGLQDESRLKQRLADLERRLEQAEARRRELAEARDKLSVVKQLALDLRSDRFQAYLLEETFRELVEGASDRLMGLTNRYALQYDENSFHVVDHDNASERRRAETLSGGETFLASLCLALELSQQVQRAAGAVRLESLFIDEGFGTLDTETLGVIADAIESLPTAGRVVGIITHLGELTDRLPVCLRVEKGPDGSRVSLRAA